MGYFLRVYFGNTGHATSVQAEGLRWRQNIFTQNCPNIIITSHHHWIMGLGSTNEKRWFSVLTNHKPALIFGQIWVNYDLNILRFFSNSQKWSKILFHHWVYFRLYILFTTYSLSCLGNICWLSSCSVQTLHKVFIASCYSARHSQLCLDRS